MSSDHLSVAFGPSKLMVRTKITRYLRMGRNNTILGKVLAQGAALGTPAHVKSQVQLWG